MITNATGETNINSKPVRDSGGYWNCFSLIYWKLRPGYVFITFYQLGASEAEHTSMAREV